MLGFEQKQRLGALAIDPRSHLHANLDRFRSYDPPHHAHALREVDKHYIVRLGWRSGMDNGDGVDGSLAARDDPIPLAVASPGLGHPRREETAPAAPRSLQAQLTVAKRRAPLLLRSHEANLWAAK